MLNDSAQSQLIAERHKTIFLIASCVSILLVFGVIIYMQVAHHDQDNLPFDMMFSGLLISVLGLLRIDQVHTLNNAVRTEELARNREADVAQGVANERQFQIDFNKELVARTAATAAAVAVQVALAAKGVAAATAEATATVLQTAATEKDKKEQP
jgi:hypothetical protein